MIVKLIHAQTERQFDGICVWIDKQNRYTPQCPPNPGNCLFTIVQCSSHAKRTLRVRNSIDVSVHLDCIQTFYHQQTVAQCHEQTCVAWTNDMYTNTPRHSHLAVSGNWRATRPAMALVGSV